MKRNFTGDITGGATSALFGLPGNIVFGLIAFAPLGDAYAGLGITAAMYSSVFVCLITSLFSNAPGMISGPRASTVLIFAAVISQTGVIKQISTLTATDAAVLLAVPFLVVVIGGMIQVLIGLFRLGNLTKYIPFPVLAGILNGTVLVIVTNQVWPFLGIEKKASLLELWPLLPTALPLNILLCIFTILLMYFSPRILPKIPAALVAILVGSLVYYLVGSLGFAGMMGPAMGRVEFLLPNAAYGSEMVSALFKGIHAEILPGLVVAGITLAVLNSVGTLLCVLSIQNYNNIRPDNNRLMIAEGLGNMTSACFGGLAGSGFLLRSKINYDSGGRTRMSGVYHSLFILIGFAFFAPLIGKIPKAVMTGIILVSILSIFDKWSIALFKKFLSGKAKERKRSLGNLLVVLLVMMLFVFYHPVAAVALGILLSVVLFMIEMGKSLIRREYQATAVHSKMYRTAKLMDLLKKHGQKIAIMELEGPIFFGTADLLATAIENRTAQGAKWIILDMKRVKTIDGTGARIIARDVHKLRRENRSVALSYVQKGSAAWQSLNDAGLFRNDLEPILFRDTDMALEYCEERLLDDVSPERGTQGAFPLHAFDILKALTARELEIFSSYLQRQRFDTGEIVFRQGDRDNAVYFIVNGAVDVTIDIIVSGMKQKKRLQTLSVGTVFGEMALIDRKRRSADVEVREPLTAMRMRLDQFEKMAEEHPKVAIRVLTGISRVLSERLRSSHDMILELEM